jgi:hypothetical protein
MTCRYVPKNRAPYAIRTAKEYQKWSKDRDVATCMSPGTVRIFQVCALFRLIDACLLQDRDCADFCLPGM